MRFKLQSHIAVREPMDTIEEVPTDPHPTLPSPTPSRSNRDTLDFVDDLPTLPMIPLADAR